MEHLHSSGAGLGGILSGEPRQVEQEADGVHEPASPGVAGPGRLHLCKMPAYPGILSPARQESSE